MSILPGALQEFLCAYHLVRKGILPRSFSKRTGSLWYEGVEINEVMRDFYVDLADLGKIFPHKQSEQPLEVLSQEP